MNDQALRVIITICLVTIGLRVLPYLMMGALQRSDYLRYLGRTMPVGVMALLVAFTLQGTDLTRPPYGLPLIGLGLLAGIVYWRTRALLLSVGVALVAYVAVMSLAFPAAA